MVTLQDDGPALQKRRAPATRAFSSRSTRALAQAAINSTLFVQRSERPSPARAAQTGWLDRELGA
jgi:hypothetical protein